jgi:hypothetical protein
MAGRRWTAAVSSVAVLVAIAGCGDGDGGGSRSGTLDQELHGAMERAGITPLDPGPEPADAKVALGRLLMFDKELSGNRDVSCATCHHSLLHTSDGLSLPIGTEGSGLGPARRRGAGRGFIPRNAPDVFDRGSPLWRSMFWDSRVSGSAAVGFTTPAGGALPDGLDSVTAAQAMFPVTSPAETRSRQFWTIWTRRSPSRVPHRMCRGDPAPRLPGSAYRSGSGRSPGRHPEHGSERFACCRLVDLSHAVEYLRWVNSLVLRDAWQGSAEEAPAAKRDAAAGAAALTPAAAADRSARRD